MGIFRCLSSKNRIRLEVTIFTRTMKPRPRLGFCRFSEEAGLHRIHRIGNHVLAIRLLMATPAQACRTYYKCDFGTAPDPRNVEKARSDLQ
jgi:hypothetical protein